MLPRPSSLKPSSLITHSPCPDCGGTMMLSCIEPAQPGYDRRTFRCAVCGYQHGVTVKIESVPLALKGIEAKSAL
jgi:predicted RNA-binding Zn-ribbon protein involved in translation (DUF1610 family)